jgi:hypothetical protein
MDVFQDSFVFTGGKNGEAVLFDVNNQEVVSKFVPYYGNEIGLVKFAPGFSIDEKEQPQRAIIAAQKQAFCGLWDLTT